MISKLTRVNTKTAPVACTAPSVSTILDTPDQKCPPRIPDLFVFLGFSVAVFSLLMLASVSTCVLGSRLTTNEHTFFLPDNMPLNAALCFAATLLCLAASQSSFCLRLQSSINCDDRTFSWCRAVLLGLLVVVGLVVAFNFQLLPRADARIVQDVAHDILQHSFGFFNDEAYIGANPHQLGLVWFSCLLEKLFGGSSYLAFRVLNALALCVCCVAMTGIVSRLGGSRCQQIALLCLALTFFPLLFYICFLYGTIIGLAFATLGLYLGLRALEGSLVSAVLCAISLAIAAFMKQNYLIFAIAVVLFALMRVTRENWRVVLLLVFAVPACCMALGAGTLELSRALSGYALDQGESSWSWIAMGIQNGDLGPGWYNGYNNETYRASAGYTDVQAAIAKRDIAQRITEMAGDPKQAAQFFILKTASQWVNPGFQGHWLVCTMPAEEGVTEWVLAVTAQETEQKLIPYLNALQTLVLFGAFTSCVQLPGKLREQPGWILLALVFLGGFVCHLVWEAKCQYTIVYYLMLFPFAIRGYAMLPNSLRKTWQSLRLSSRRQRDQRGRVLKAYRVALIAMCLGVFTLLLATGSLDNLTADVMDDVGLIERAD